MNAQNNITPTTRDVLNGRGQGVQRHPGNVKYRKLVFVNKGLYAKCPRSDKIKISKGIVAAIRESGGRFLEHNEREDFYFDIGDKKATEKTSQALREGQKDIRKNLYKNEAGVMANSTSSEETNQASNVTGMPAEPEMMGKQLPPEDYSQYSLLVLEALYNSDHDLPVPPSMTPTPAPAKQPVKEQPPPPPPLPAIQNNMMYGVPNHAYMGHTSNAAMAMALDQFPGIRMAPMPQQVQHPMQQFDPRTQFAMGKDLSHPSFRLTDMSMGSAFSIRELLESVRNTGFQPMGLRGTFDSMLSAGTLEMIRQSQLQLNQIDQMDIEDLNPSQVEIDALFDRNTMSSDDGGDRISDLRFSDLSKDRFTDFQNARNTDCSNARNTDCSETSKNTSYSGSSSGREVSSHDSESAQLLLGLANHKMEE